MGIEQKGIGSPFPSKFGSEFAHRFWPKVNKTGGCWLWTGATVRNGYGRFRIYPKTITAHRFAWINTNGPISDNLCVLHRCDIRICVNPKHLYLGTKSDNMRDMFVRGRHPLLVNIKRGEESGLSVLTNTAVMEIRSEYKNAPWGSKGAVAELLARRFGVTKATITNAALGYKWTHI